MSHPMPIKLVVESKTPQMNYIYNAVVILICYEVSFITMSSLQKYVTYLFTCNAGIGCVFCKIFVLNLNNICTNYLISLSCSLDWEKMDPIIVDTTISSRKCKREEYKKIISWVMTSSY